MTGRRDPRTWLRELQRAVSWHRRLLAAGLAAASVAVAIDALQPPPPATTQVLAAARDLAAGTTLQATDLRPAALATGTLPDGALRRRGDVTGRLLAAPMRRGEPLTDVRLVGPALLSGYGRGLVATPVRIADSEAARLLRGGDVVDVLAAANPAVADSALSPDSSAEADQPQPQARVVAAQVRVIAVPRPPDDGFSAAGGGIVDGALIVLATTPETASRLAGAAVTATLSVTLRAA